MNAQTALAFATAVAIAFSGLLAFYDIKGWGWFLFVGLLLGFVIGDIAGKN